MKIKSTVRMITDILMQHSAGKSALIFCSTRKGAQEAAQCLSRTAMGLGYSNPFIKSNQQRERLKEASLSCSDKQMQSCIPNGGNYLRIDPFCPLKRAVLFMFHKFYKLFQENYFETS